MRLSAQLPVAGDDLLQRCKTVQEVLLCDPKLNVLMDVGPETEKKKSVKTQNPSESSALTRFVKVSVP